MFEICKQFRFEAAHTLRRQIKGEASGRIHGHSYRAEVALRGLQDGRSGMVVDIGELELAIASVRKELDHHFLDELPDLGPATLENIALWTWTRIAASFPNLTRVSVFRDSEGDSCHYFGPRERLAND